MENFIICAVLLPWKQSPEDLRKPESVTDFKNILQANDKDT